MWQRSKKFIIKNNGSEIHPEEIFLDTSIHHSPEDLLNEAKLETPFLYKKFTFLFAVIVILLVVILGRSGQLIFIKGKELAQKAMNNAERLIFTPALRGIIYDNQGNPLVENVPLFTLEVTPQDLPKDASMRAALLQSLAQDAGISVTTLEQLVEKYKYSFQPIVIDQNLSYDTSLSLKSKYATYPSVVVGQNPKRHYLSDAFSSLIGYVGLANSQDIANGNFATTDYVGKLGLEKEYDSILRGQDSVERLVLNAQGSIQERDDQQNMVPGENLQLTIDGGLQQFVYDRLKQETASVGRQGAAAVVLNPNNGAILSMVSIPGFDANAFSDANASSTQSILNDPAAPLLNHAISATFPSGSIIKPFIALAALMENVVKPTDTIFDSGEITVQNQYDPSVVYHFKDWRALGVVDMYKAISMSCDVYFYTVGGGYGNIAGLGPDRIAKYLNEFGFGKPTGIDLPLESSGLVPTPDWKQKTIGQPWSLGDTYHYSIGQGYFLTTPLQIANALGALINGGNLWTPHVADKIVDNQKNTIKTLSFPKLASIPMNPDDVAVVKEGMRETVTQGTAKILQQVSQPVAGKTGTAQYGNEGKTHAWFLGYGPYDNPQIVVVVLVQGGGEGSSAAVPVAKDIFNWYFAHETH